MRHSFPTLLRALTRRARPLRTATLRAMTLTRPRPDARLVRIVVVRGVGLAGLCAFGSLWLQARGLFGSRGITPIAEYLALVEKAFGTRPWQLVPSILWLDSSDAAIQGLCAAGTLATLAVVVGAPPRLPLAVTWVCWLSLCAAQNTFLNFQWDSLLLEALVLAWLLAPRGLLRTQDEGGPTNLALGLMRWLAMRLYLLSGLVKLQSGDPTWRDGTALQYHFWSQPLPTWTSYVANAMPGPLQRLNTWGSLATELLVPLLLLGPRRVRLLAVGLMALLQVGIATTGNYGYFNLLSLAILVAWLDDDALRKVLPRRWHPDAEVQPFVPWRGVALLVAGTTLALLATLTMFQAVAPTALPEALDGILTKVAPFRSINSYGLFATMTTERPEIVLEGSRDGRTWLPYAFRAKPGRVDRRPPFVQPHMPRLDWQLWFAALGSCRNQPWFLQWCQRLLQGEPAVLGLLDGDPFAGTPPRYLRSTSWQYRFATWADVRRGVWWKRSDPQPYCPVLTLRGGELAIADDLE